MPPISESSRWSGSGLGFTSVAKIKSFVHLAPSAISCYFIDGKRSMCWNINLLLDLPKDFIVGKHMIIMTWLFPINAFRHAMDISEVVEMQKCSRG